MAQKQQCDPDPNKFRLMIMDALEEVRDERIARPSLGVDDRDLVDIIEDLMDTAFERGRAAWGAR